MSRTMCYYVVENVPQINLVMNQWAEWDQFNKCTPLNFEKELA